MAQLYQLDQKKQDTFAGIYLLDRIINHEEKYDIVSLQPEQEILQPLLSELDQNGFVELQDRVYFPTDKGRELLKKFLQRYTDFLNIFDVYCAVDLEQGEFAFSSFLSIQDPAEWKVHMSHDRWEDLRVAVCEFKGIDPIEIVFMSFIQEKRFEHSVAWQYQLISGDIWSQILAICNSAVNISQLAYDDVSGESVIEDVIRQGGELLAKLHKEEGALREAILHEEEEAEAEENEARRQRREDDDEDEYETVVVVYDDYDYWDPWYYDPWYVSPFWYDPWDSYYYW